LVLNLKKKNNKSNNIVAREVHFTSFNLNNFKTIEAMGLKIIASKSP
jgi:hypothetical protein